MLIRTVEPADAPDWERMRQAFWPAPAGEHAAEIAAYLHGRRDNPAEVFIARDDDGRAKGFAEVSIRPYAEGCRYGKVAYLEGWYVEPEARRTGIGTALVRAVESWARSQGCSELASDTATANAVGKAAHRALGFDETARIICYRKNL